ncbi:hypothetical protein KW842_00950 [Duganella sp. sic0402]|uniref:hypothetical protein n=1 Tax=Duganella sp. sic0402 TaxID=2854786 RepID=UPI001C441A2D|nr:hypothetical protein [Duganella sp. sic0402]MBV7534321.1 hypothetical protein [Duganella sp. sic0402]
MFKKLIFSIFFLVISNLAFGKEILIKLAGGIEVSVSEENFIAAAHTVKGCSQAYSNCEVDGALAFGGVAVPKTTLKRITVTIGNARYELDTSGMYNPLIDSKFAESFGGFCYDKNNCSFRGAFGDAGGVYAAEWVIKNGKAYRTSLSDSADFFQFVKSHLSPPQYN